MSSQLIVVGAGVVGLTVAYEALRDPQVRVTLVDRSGPLAGISGRAGAGDLPLGWSERHEDLMRRSWHWHDTVLGSGPWRTRHLSVWFNLSDETRKMIMGGTSRLDEPEAAIGDHAGAASWMARGGDVSWGYRISPHLLGAELLRRMRSTSRLTELTAHVSDVVRDGDGVRAIVDGERVAGDAAVAAVGPWVRSQDNSWREVAEAEGVRTKRVFGFRARVAPETRGDVIFADADAGLFVMPTTRPDELALSIKHAEWDVEPGEAPLPPEVLARGLEFLAMRTPVGPVLAHEKRVHVDTYNHEAVPVVRPTAGAVVVTGTHGSGVRLSSGLAQDALALALPAHDPRRLS
jgi:glycine/D-amino acid oxidase-like deaminating enzyme